MKGKVIGLENDNGVISGDDGKRYKFDLNEYRGNSQVHVGANIDFEVNNDSAIEIYPIASSDKTNERLTTALIAIFLGAFGVHKFYLGYKKQGIITIVLSPLGVFMITGAIGIIEGIIYISKSDEEFKKIYVDGSRPWF